MRERKRQCRRCKEKFGLGELVCTHWGSMCKACWPKKENEENEKFYSEIKALMDVLTKENEYKGYEVRYNEERKDVVDIVVPQWHHDIYNWGFFSGVLVHTILKHVPNAMIWHVNKRKGKQLYIGFARGDKQYREIVADMMKRRESLS